MFFCADILGNFIMNSGEILKPYGVVLGKVRGSRQLAKSTHAASCHTVLGPYPGSWTYHLIGGNLTLLPRAFVYLFKIKGISISKGLDAVEDHMSVHGSYSHICFYLS